METLSCSNVSSDQSTNGRIIIRRKRVGMFTRGIIGKKSYGIRYAEYRTVVVAVVELGRGPMHPNSGGVRHRASYTRSPRAAARACCSTGGLIVAQLKCTQQYAYTNNARRRGGYKWAYGARDDVVTLRVGIRTPFLLLISSFHIARR